MASDPRSLSHLHADPCHDTASNRGLATSGMRGLAGFAVVAAAISAVPSTSAATLAGSTWLHPFQSCLLAGGLKGLDKGILKGAIPTSRHTDGARPQQKKNMSNQWKTMRLFDVEEAYGNGVAEAEATFRAAQEARAKRVPVTGSSDAEQALNDIVSAYMGVIKSPGRKKRMHRSPSSSAMNRAAAATATADALATTSSTAASQPSAKAAEDLRIRYATLTPTAPPRSPIIPARSTSPGDVASTLSAATAAAAPSSSEASPLVEGVTPTQEQEWRDACLKALSDAGKPNKAKLQRSTSAPELTAMGREMSWGKKVRKWGDGVEEKPPGVTGRAPTVEEVFGIVGKVLSKAQRARKTLLHPGALDALFLALAVLSDPTKNGGEEAGMGGGLRGGGVGYELEEMEEAGIVEAGAEQRRRLNLKGRIAGVAKRVAMAGRVLTKRRRTSPE